MNRTLTFRQKRSSGCGSVEKNPTSVHEDVGLIPGLAHVGQGCGIARALV